LFRGRKHNEFLDKHLKVFPKTSCQVFFGGINDKFTAVVLNVNAGELLKTEVNAATKKREEEGKKKNSKKNTKEQQLVQPAGDLRGTIPSYPSCLLLTCQEQQQQASSLLQHQGQVRIAAEEEGDCHCIQRALCHFSPPSKVCFKMTQLISSILPLPSQLTMQEARYLFPQQNTGA